MNTDRLRTQRPLPLVLSMGIPMAFSMLINALYNIVDGYFVAKMSRRTQTMPPRLALPSPSSTASLPQSSSRSWGVPSSAPLPRMRW